MYIIFGRVLFCITGGWQRVWDEKLSCCTVVSAASLAPRCTIARQSPYCDEIAMTAVPKDADLAVLQRGIMGKWATHIGVLLAIGFAGQRGRTERPEPPFACSLHVSSPCRRTHCLSMPSPSPQKAGGEADCGSGTHSTTK
jgi:hypothetical protein